jgi:HK97 family phage major capsid protein
MLKALMLKKKIDDAKAELATLRETEQSLDIMESGLAEDVAEAQTEEEQRAVEQAIEKFDNDRSENIRQIQEVTQKIELLESQLTETERKSEKPIVYRDTNIRKDDTRMKPDNIFRSLPMEERTVLMRDSADWLASLRECIKQKRALTNAGLTIPENMLPFLREQIYQSSKLISLVNKVAIKGTGKTVIMGTVPEAVWTSMSGALNEITLGFNDIEVDGWKVGAYIKVSNDIIEDSDLNLSSIVITALGESLAKALDKAIVFGDGVRMPLGIFTRLAQTAQPSGYPATARAWVDLHESNIKTIPATTKAKDLFVQITLHSGIVDNFYSTKELTWLMNRKTHTALTAEAINFNASGAIVTGINNSMPVVSGNIVELPFMPENMILFGYTDLYTLVERSGQKLLQSSERFFLEEQTVFKGSARYDGVPVIAEAFGAIGINGTTPDASEIVFPADTAN